MVKSRNQKIDCHFLYVDFSESKKNQPILIDMCHVKKKIKRYYSLPTARLIE